MPVVSIRFTDDRVHARLKDVARRHNLPLSTLAERLIDEGLRSVAHPLIAFRNGPAGRRPVLLGGPEVADVVAAIVLGDVPAGERRARAADMLDISEAQVDAAMAYYADFTAEIDASLTHRRQQADEAEERWRRQQALLEG